jgi:hypothetical protein
MEGGNTVQLYSEGIHWFNEQVRTHGENIFFGNFAPVPPFSLLLYAPFTFLGSLTAKCVFNVLSLFILCLCFGRYLKLVGVNPLQALTAIPLLLFPLYQNMAQGQSYFLITAALFEVYVLYQQKRIYLLCFYIALLFHVKFFPAFILFFFFFKKEYKIVLISIAMIVLLGLITLLLVGKATLDCYLTDILPRLIKGEVVDPFYYGHQGLSIFLREIFSYDALMNPQPPISFSLLANVLEGLVAGLVIYLCSQLVRSGNPVLSYALTIFSGILISRYTTSYSLVMLFPLILTQFNFRRGIWLAFIFALALNLPLSLLEDAPLLLKYSRILLMFVAFYVIVREVKVHFHFVTCLAFCLVFILLNLFFASEPANNYFLKAGSRGVPYDFHFYENRVILRRCLGNTHETDTLDFPVKIQSVAGVDERFGKSIYPLLPAGRQNIVKAFVVNDSAVVYLSDLNQGPGMNKLRMTLLR